MYYIEDDLPWSRGDGGTIVFNGLLFSDDGYGNYIQGDIRTCLYCLYNWLM